MENIRICDKYHGEYARLNIRRYFAAFSKKIQLAPLLAKYGKADDVSQRIGSHALKV